MVQNRLEICSFFCTFRQFRSRLRHPAVLLHSPEPDPGGPGQDQLSTHRQRPYESDQQGEL